LLCELQKHRSALKSVLECFDIQTLLRLYQFDHRFEVWQSRWVSDRHVEAPVPHAKPCLLHPLGTVTQIEGTHEHGFQIIGSLLGCPPVDVDYLTGLGCGFTVVSRAGFDQICFIDHRPIGFFYTLGDIAQSGAGWLSPLLGPP
jgi:hypothetical protein